MQDFIFSNDFYKSIELMVYTSGHEKCRPLHSYGPAVRSSFMFHYIHSGKGTYHVRDQVYHLKAGDMFLMIPGERIFYQADADDPWEYSWIGLQGIKAEECVRRSRIYQDLVCSVTPDSQIVQIFSRLQNAAELRNADLLFNACAWEFVYQLSTSTGIEEKQTPLSADEYTEMVLSYVEQNFERPISVQEIADHLALDRSYVHRIFKKRMNMSVKEYILSLRMANACSYLIHTDLSISDIARSVGYDDVLYFSRLFRKKKGLSPSEYRQSKQKQLSANAILPDADTRERKKKMLSEASENTGSGSRKDPDQ